MTAGTVLRAKIGGVGGLDLLVIGYSGDDRSVVEVFKNCGKPLRSMLVVDRNAREAERIAQKLAQELGVEGSVTQTRPEGNGRADFERFVQGPGLDRYTEQLTAAREADERAWPRAMTAVFEKERSAVLRSF